MELKDKIRALRKQKNLSQEQVAEHLGVSRQAVSKWESGLSKPDTENLLALAELFQVSVDEFLTEPPAKEKKSSSRTFFFWMLGSLVVLLALLYLWLSFIRATPNSLKNYASTRIAVDLTEPETTPAQPEEEVTASSETDAPSDTSQLLNSPDSVAVQELLQTFVKAYFSQDLDMVKTCIANLDSAEVYEENVWDNLQSCVLKWNPEDLTDADTLSVQYQFQENGTDSASYLGIDLIKGVDGWKVSQWYLEK